MTGSTRSSTDDWTRGPALPLGAAVLIAVAGLGLVSGGLDGRGRPGPSDSSLLAAAGTVIDVNTASEAQLQLLPGIGPKRARAIVEDRERHGRFASLDDLERVTGIGPRTVEGLRDLATTGP